MPPKELFYQGEVPDNGTITENNTLLNGTWLGNLHDKAMAYSNENYTHPIKGSYARAYDGLSNIYNTVKDGALGWTPLGDVADAVGIANDVNKGNYGSAAMTAGLMFLPGSANKLKQMGINLLDNVNLSKLRGMIDELRFDIYDKFQGYNIYKNMPDASGIHSYKPYDPSHNTTVDKIYTVGGKQRQGLELTDEELEFAKDTPYTSGIHKDDEGQQLLSTAWDSDNINNTDFTFMGNYDYLRNATDFSKRSFRMGFTPLKGMTLPKSFVQANREAIEHAPSGSFISADAMGLTIPESMELYKKMGISSPLYAAKEGNFYIGGNQWGMSADAYRFFTREAQKPGRKLVYAGKAGLFNDAAVNNPQVYQWQTDYKDGKITAQQYINNFNNWVKEFGGRPGHVDPKTGEPFIYHPVIYKKEYGGTINYLNLFK